MIDLSFDTIFSMIMEDFFQDISRPTAVNFIWNQLLQTFRF